MKHFSKPYFLGVIEYFGLIGVSVLVLSFVFLHFRINILKIAPLNELALSQYGYLGATRLGYSLMMWILGTMVGVYGSFLIRSYNLSDNSFLVLSYVASVASILLVPLFPMPTFSAPDVSEILTHPHHIIGTIIFVSTPLAIFAFSRGILMTYPSASLRSRICSILLALGSLGIYLLSRSIYLLEIWLICLLWVWFADVAFHPSYRKR